MKNTRMYVETLRIELENLKIEAMQIEAKVKTVSRIIWDLESAIDKDSREVTSDVQLPRTG